MIYMQRIVFAFESINPCEGSEPSQGFKSENEFGLNIALARGIEAI